LKRIEASVAEKQGSGIWACGGKRPLYSIALRGTWNFGYFRIGGDSGIGTDFPYSLTFTLNEDQHPHWFKTDGADS
jgi:hypothetical protein